MAKFNIPTPNYTQSPNIFFDEIVKTLKEGELRLVLVIMRQTFGWHKPADRISISQLAEKSGMERKSVCRSLNSLIEKGLIIKKTFGVFGRERCYYSLVMESSEEEKTFEDDGIETEEEMMLISNNSDQCPKDTPPVSLGHPPSVLKTPTKETPSKEPVVVVRAHAQGFDFSQIYRKALNLKKDWSTPEIDEACTILGKLDPNSVSDHFAYVEGIIIKNRNKTYSETKKYGDKSCQMNQKTSEKREPLKKKYNLDKGIISEKSTSEPLFQTFKRLKELT